MRDAAEGFLQAFLVVPGQPSGRRQFYLGDGAPWFTAVNRLGPVDGSDGLGEGVVVTIAP